MKGEDCMPNQWEVLEELDSRKNRCKSDARETPWMKSTELEFGSSRQNVNQILNRLLKEELVDRTGKWGTYRFQITDKGSHELYSYRIGSKRRATGGRYIDMQEIQTNRPVLYSAMNRHNIRSYTALAMRLLNTRGKCKEDNDKPDLSASSIQGHIKKLEEGDARWWIMSGDRIYGMTKHLVQLVPEAQILIDSFRPKKDRRINNRATGRKRGVHRNPSTSPYYIRLTEKYQATVDKIKKELREKKSSLVSVRKELAIVQRRLRRITTIVKEDKKE